ncbi:MAG: GNAT family N-acetyltransferase [Rhodopseudomonas palustris]|uniref:GNAT family N-acetyltransferase n=1 Tax=Rhodopseudomonas palustris TaxID=1076 RepID=A0A933S219_RHOPL|nr:GNAT family N-acetyltransferase [Rhodopseudomonas palustris]
MAFEILSAEGRDRERWSALIEALPPHLRDLHFLPEYGMIYRDCFGFEPLLAVYQEGDDFVLQPYVRRPLGQLPFLQGAADSAVFSDLANPYGFGGPLSNAADADSARRLYGSFAASLAEWCDREQIASEFTSLHPVLNEHQLQLTQEELSPVHEKDIYYIDLKLDEEELWRKLRRGHRASINLARRNEVRVEKVEPTEDNLRTLNALYAASMQRRGAAQRWRFPPDFFTTTIRWLGERGSSLFFGYRGARVASAYILIHGYETVYYHFSGTNADDGRIGIDTLMFFEMASWARSQGYARCFLGGGVTRREEDGLRQFKSGFASVCAPLYTYFRIRNRSVYDDLCSRKREFEIATTGQESASTFLPQYRR